MSESGTPSGVSTTDLWTRALLAFVLYESVLLGMGLLFGVRELRGDDPASVERSAFAGASGLLLALVLFRGGSDVIASWRPRCYAKGLALYALFMGGWVPFAMIAYPVIMSRLGHPLTPQPFVAYFDHREVATAGGLAAVLVVSCLLAPLVEEIVFRGYIQTAMVRVLPASIGVLVTSVLFGLLHGPQYAIPIGLLGLCFGALRERFDSVAVGAVAHMVHNSLTCGVTLVFPEMFEWVYSR